MSTREQMELEEKVSKAADVFNQLLAVVQKSTTINGRVDEDTVSEIMKLAIDYSDANVRIVIKEASQPIKYKCSNRC